MTVSDIPEVIAIGLGAPEMAVSDVSTFWGEDRLQSWLEAERDIMLVAEENGEVLGFQLTQLHLPSGVGYLSDLAVKEGVRGKGLGTILTEETLKLMKDKGITYVYGLTQQNNEKIHNLLKKLGFSEAETMIWFEKRIDP